MQQQPWSLLKAAFPTLSLVKKNPKPGYPPFQFSPFASTRKEDSKRKVCILESSSASSCFSSSLSSTPSFFLSFLVPSVVVVAAVKGENAFCLDLLHPFLSEKNPHKNKATDQKRSLLKKKAFGIIYLRLLFSSTLLFSLSFLNGMTTGTAYPRMRP